MSEESRSGGLVASSVKCVCRIPASVINRQSNVCMKCSEANRGRVRLASTTTTVCVVDVSFVKFIMRSHVAYIYVYSCWYGTDGCAQMLCYHRDVAHLEKD